MSSINYYLTQPWFPYAFALMLSLPVIVLLRQFVYEYIKMKNQELKMLTVKGNAENKSQAYERMMLFLERIKPANLVSRFDKNLKVHEFVFLTEKTISEEFDYNLSQQIYITKNSWKNIVDSKAGVLKILHDCYENLNENVSLEEYKTIFLMNYVNGEDFVGETMDQLRKEIVIIT